MLDDPRLPGKFWAKVIPCPMSGCWLWVGATNGRGYGHFWLPERQTTKIAHGLSFETFVGSVPAGLELDHKCRVRCCTNPDHLEAVTHLENVRRGESNKASREKTHCKHGHEFSPSNTMITKKGNRWCRGCGRRANKEQYLRKVGGVLVGRWPQ